MTDFDLEAAALKHLNWKTRFRRYLNGAESISRAELVSHHECHLGKWLDGEGKAAHASNPVFGELNIIHEKLHKLTIVILEHKEAGRLEEAKQQLDALDPVTDRIVSLLRSL